MRSKKEVQLAAKKAFQSLCGEGYFAKEMADVEVFNNNGWYYAIRHQHFGIFETILKGGKVQYHCLMSPNGRGAGKPEWSSKLCNTPREALLDSLERAEKNVQEQADALEEIKALFGRRIK